MQTINIKPLSVNKAWQGRRYKTKDYKSYEKEALLKLPAIDLPKGKLSIYLEFGVSNSGFDWDNGIKPFQDILQKKYGFNDSRVVNAVVLKRMVDKGSEYISFNLTPSNIENHEARSKSLDELAALGQELGLY